MELTKIYRALQYHSASDGTAGLEEGYDMRPLPAPGARVAPK